jgi:hypothetical protein
MDQHTEEKIKAAAAGKGEVMLVETDVPGAEVAAFRVPTSMEWQRYRTGSKGTPEQVATSAKPLVFSCCIYPEPTVFEAAVDGHPGLVETYIGELLEHAGANRAKKVHKL